MPYNFTSHVIIDGINSVYCAVCAYNLTSHVIIDGINSVYYVVCAYNLTSHVIIDGINSVYCAVCHTTSLVTLLSMVLIVFTVLFVHTT